MEQSSKTRDKIRERRLDRMRLGQAVCDYVTLPSDDEIRVCIVPLTEADYRNVLQRVSALNTPDDLAGVQMKDRVQAQEICVRAIREENDLTTRVYDDVDDMLEDFTVGDIDFVIDAYSEMIERSSPSLDGIPPEELENLKKVLQEMDWNALSGSAWYAAKRFLSRITPSPLLDKSPGSSSTSLLTTTKNEDESTSDA
jgi:hypothetical protein